MDESDFLYHRYFFIRYLIGNFVSISHPLGEHICDIYYQYNFRNHEREMYFNVELQYVLRVKDLKSMCNNIILLHKLITRLITFLERTQNLFLLNLQASKFNAV